MNLTVDVVLFYGTAFVVLTYFFHKKTKLLLSVAISMLIVLVASEYYEIPIFVVGFLGLWGNHPYPSLSFVLHHLNTTMLFVWLLYLAKIKIKIDEIILMLWGVGMNTWLIFTNPGNPVNLFFARIMGISVLLVVVVIGSSVVGVES